MSAPEVTPVPSGLLAVPAFTEITRSAPGKLLVGGTGQFTTTCGPNPCSTKFGLYVGGQPVPGSFRTLSGAATEMVTRELTFFGVADSQPAGSVDVLLGRYTSSGTGVTNSSEDAQVVALALGD